EMGDESRAVGHRYRSAESRGRTHSMMPETRRRQQAWPSAGRKVPHGKMRVMPMSATSSATLPPLQRVGESRGAGAHWVSAWLFAGCALVVAMIVVCGVTRLP